MDNKFDVNGNKWFRKRWQIRFVKNITNGAANCNGKNYPDIWSYMIYTNESFSCPAGICDNNPNNSEVAKNPLNNLELLSGGYNNYLCPENSYNTSDEQSMKSMRLEEEYGITDVSFTGGCKNNARYIHFDNIGRPFNSLPYSPYALSAGSYQKLITSTCNIVLSNSDSIITIQIEPETGYTHILQNN